MSLTETQVITALQQSVISAVAQSSTPTLPIKFLNVAFTKPSNGKWLELVYLPNPPSDQSWNDERIYRGIYNLILHWPNDGGGSYSVTDLAESIMRKYNKSKKIDGRLSLLRQPRVSNVIEADKELVIVISLEYTSFSW